MHFEEIYDFSLISSTIEHFLDAWCRFQSQLPWDCCTFSERQKLLRSLDNNDCSSNSDNDSNTMTRWEREWGSEREEEEEKEKKGCRRIHTDRQMDIEMLLHIKIYNLQFHFPQNLAQNIVPTQYVYIMFSMRFDFSYFCLDGNSEGMFVRKYKHFSFSISIFTICFSLLFVCAVVCTPYFYSFWIFFSSSLVHSSYCCCCCRWCYFFFSSSFAECSALRMTRTTLLSSPMSNNKVNTMINNTHRKDKHTENVMASCIKT